MWRPPRSSRAGARRARAPPRWRKRRRQALPHRAFESARPCPRPRHSGASCAPHCRVLSRWSSGSCLTGRRWLTSSMSRWATSTSPPRRCAMTGRRMPPASPPTRLRHAPSRSVPGRVSSCSLASAAATRRNCWRQFVRPSSAWLNSSARTMPSPGCTPCLAAAPRRQASPRRCGPSALCRSWTPMGGATRPCARNCAARPICRAPSARSQRKGRRANPSST